MIEFKQIIGRGTRLYEGKDYFTIYDFVKAHQHFSDPEWDGEPQDAEPCRKCGQETCVCEPVERKPCEICGTRPCECPKESCDVCHQFKCVCQKIGKIKVKLADGKAREIQHMMMTSFWPPDGTPMSSQQFMEMLFGKLREFFQSETELRAIWSSPDTRVGLLESLAAEGFGSEQLTEMQRTMDAQNSDLFDVLAYVAYALPKVTRAARAATARVHIDSEFDDKQRAFLDFVLGHYVSEGVEELDQKKLTLLLRLKYHDLLSDALADLGKPEEIGRVFAGFQKYLLEYVPLVFPNTVGKLHRSSNFDRRVWHPIRTLAKLGDDFVFHDLRHTQASLLLAAGVNMKVVQERLGHSDYSLTANTYSHLLQGAQADAVAKTDQFLKDRSKLVTQSGYTNDPN